MKKGFIYIAIATLMFSTMEIALKFICDIYNPIQLNFIRFFIGGMVLLPFAIRKLKTKKITLSPRDLIPFIGIGFIGISVSMTLYQFSVIYAEASVVAIIFSSNPLFVMILAYFILGESIHRRNVFALIFDLLGIFFIIAPWRTSINITGEILIIISTVLFALYGVIGKKYSDKYNGVVTTCFSSLFGSAILMVMSALTHIPAIGDALASAGLSSFAYIPFVSGFSWSTLPYLLYVGICVTGIGYATYFMAMEKTSANTASLVFFFKPVLAPILAYFFLQEIPTFNRYIGLGFILLGSLINIIPPLLHSHGSKKEPAPDAGIKETDR